MFACVKSMGLLGIDGFMIDVQADISRGLPTDVVGLPKVRESRDRVRSSIKNCGFIPNQPYNVNLAPADAKGRLCLRFAAFACTVKGERAA